MPKKLEEMTDEELAQAEAAGELEKAGEPTQDDDDDVVDPPAEPTVDPTPDPDPAADPAADPEADAADPAPKAEDAVDPDRLQQLLSEDDSDDSPGKQVPYSRFKEKVEETRDLRLILKSLLGRDEQQQPAAPPADPDPDPPQPEVDIKALASEYHKAVADMDADKASEAYAVLQEAQEKVTAWKIEMAARNARKQALQEIESKQRVDSIKQAQGAIYAKYPFLDNASKLADEAAIIAVNQKARMLVAEGMEPAMALAEAAEKIGGRFAKLYEPAKPAQAPTAAAADPRTQLALARGKEGFQPPAKPGIGNKDVEGRKPFNELTDEEIDKLTPKQLEEYKYGTA